MQSKPLAMCHTLMSPAPKSLPYLVAEQCTMISVILLAFCVIVFVEFVCDGAELVVYVDRNAKH